ncbi:ATP-binding protein [Fulvivirga ligni]|uniref:Dph6-related ATP pyrophosphatase n=1 Tax=Fulvivirga ligni TaxID=2904246 RepID=UPI001F31B046|nr:ATP-binding protein [Fulvivirga ligni]UII21723.1 ATP-binding protein [Fulvivirga ligni]
MKKISISWSGGKDSMLALDRIVRSEKYSIHHLHTVIDADLKRVGLHGVPEHLIERQAESLGIPLHKLYLRKDDSHDTYNQLISDYIQGLKSEGVELIMYGDIFLEYLKAFRDTKLASAEMHGVYPIWKEPSEELLAEFLEKGYKTRICAADKKHFDKSQVGQTIDDQWIRSAPEGIDICGENGEFHSFVYDGPIFKNPVAHQVGEIVEKSYEFKVKNDDGSLTDQKSTFYFADLS